MYTPYIADCWLKTEIFRSQRYRRVWTSGFFLPSQYNAGNKNATTRSENSMNFHRKKSICVGTKNRDSAAPARAPPSLRKKKVEQSHSLMNSTHSNFARGLDRSWSLVTRVVSSVKIHADPQKREPGSPQKSSEPKSWKITILLKGNDISWNITSTYSMASSRHNFLVQWRSPHE